MQKQKKSKSCKKREKNALACQLLVLHTCFVTFPKTIRTLFLCWSISFKQLVGGRGKPKDDYPKKDDVFFNGPQCKL